MSRDKISGHGIIVAGTSELKKPDPTVSKIWIWRGVADF